ncbi:hypothetical protein BD770DRAFT_455884 [Pilaira anomala]|nr:hypothetical protein BD770DRAFT_455884 [Pilaira anomala]
MHKENKLSEIDECIAKIEKLVGSSAGQALDDLIKLIKSGRKDTNNTLGFGINAAMNANQSNNLNNNPDHPNADGISNDTETKVNHLFATLEKVDLLLNLTPALSTRLKALQRLHTEPASFSQSGKAISEEQTRMTDELKSLTTTCDLLVS